MTTLAPPPQQEGGRPSHRAAPPDDGGLAARGRRLLLGRPEDPRWARPALWAIRTARSSRGSWRVYAQICSGSGALGGTGRAARRALGTALGAGRMGPKSSLEPAAT
jgi:hypothetical protein